MTETLAQRKQRYGTISELRDTLFAMDPRHLPQALAVLLADHPKSSPELLHECSNVIGRMGDTMERNKRPDSSSG